MSFFDETIQVAFGDMLMAFSDALNLIDARLSDHHLQVAYICYEMAKHLEMDPAFTRSLVRLALVHDIGAFDELERDRMVSFEVESAMDHAVNGYLILQEIGLYQAHAEAILYHHTHYEGGNGFKKVSPEIARLAQLIFLADRVSVLVLTGDRNVLSSSKAILKTIKKEQGRLFNPAYVEVLTELEKYDSFWLNVITANKKQIVSEILDEHNGPITYETFQDFIKLFVFSMDFRSRFTASHSTGVAHVAKSLAKLCGYDDDVAQIMETAGYFHDIGKLVIPYEILDKPSKLDDNEFNLIRQHPYYTYVILDNIKGMEMIRDIAAYHHETMDGEGYPYRLDPMALSEEARLLTVADILTALTEERPYRENISNERTAEILVSFIDKGKIDQKIGLSAIRHLEILKAGNLKVQQGVFSSFDAMAEKKRHLTNFHNIATFPSHS